MFMEWLWSGCGMVVVCTEKKSLVTTIVQLIVCEQLMEYAVFSSDRFGHYIL